MLSRFLQRPLLWSLLVAAALTSCVSPRAPTPPAFSFLRVKDGITVDEAGSPVVLKGCNAGNWFLLEMWMLDYNEVRDHTRFEAALEDRFGREKKDRLMELFRENWMTARDFELLRSFNFNVVRLPINYTLLMDDDRPYELKPEGIRWIDRAIELAAQQGMYTILDLHGAPGRQSTDHTTGHEDQNKLWKDPEHRKQFVWIWSQLAFRYRDNPAVAAYDLINEPFGDYKTSNHTADMVSLLEETYTAVRKVDARHIIIMAGTRDGFAFYGSPADHGWENVMYTEHYYPGVYTGGGLAPHRHHINQMLPAITRHLRDLQVPLLVGEFNVVFNAAGGATLMRQYFDLYADHGWWATMWSYKIISRRGGFNRDNWYLVTNKDPAPPFSLRRSSYEEIEAFFRWLGTMEYAVNEPLRAALTTDTPARIPLEEPPPPMVAPFTDPLPDGWQATTIASRPAGGQRVLDPQSFDIYGGGRDIWNARDEFYFVWQKLAADHTLSATITGFDEVNPYAKAGLMLRSSLDPDAAALLLHVFPSRQIVIGLRKQRGAAMEEIKFPIREFPVRLRLVKTGGSVAAAYAAGSEDWRDAGTFDLDWLNAETYTGMAVLSHDDRYLARGQFRDITLNKE